MADEYTQEQEKLVIIALENPKFTWRTIDGIVDDTNLTTDVVEAVIRDNTSIVIKAPVLSMESKELFTTREHFSSKTDAVSKLFGAFKNRII